MQENILNKPDIVVGGLVKVNQSILATPKNQDPEDNSQAWAQDVIRDATKKYDEIKGMCASIPIITTTGYDQAASMSSRNEKPTGRPKHPRRCRSDRVTFNQQNVGSTASSFERFQESPLPNIWPKSALMAKALAVDTTSTKLQGVIDQGIESQISNHLHKMTAEMGRDKSLVNTSPTSTFLTERNEQGKGGHDSRLPQHHIAHDVPMSTPQKDLESDTTERFQTEDLVLQIPGQYPSHADDKDGIADPSSDRRTGGFCRKASLTVKVGSVWLFELYCGMIWPVFVSKSEYWKRRRQEKNNWKDCVRLFLATPMVLGLIVTFMWTMRLVGVMRDCREKDWQCVASEAVSLIVGGR